MADANGQAEGRARWLSPKLVVAAVVAVLAVVFIAQNRDEGRFDFLWMSVTAPRWIWLLVIFAAGVVVGSIFPWFRPKRARRQRQG